MLLARRFLILTLFLAALVAAPLAAYAQAPRAASRVDLDALLRRMTLEEKLGQLTQYSWQFATGPTREDPAAAPEAQHHLIRTGMVGSYLNAFGAAYTRELQRIAVEESRLKIPLLFGMDVIHGYRTIFPTPLAEACSWNPEAAALSARIAAAEASAVGLHWTFAPMLDIARDARWGRIVEGAGEDTYLGMVLGAARVRGFQGDDLRAPESLLACAKHFAAYGVAEGGRDYNTVDISERTLRSVYLPPFKAAVQAGVGTFMSSFNEIAGIPSTGNPFLLTTVLRDEWKFDGFVVSDWNSIGEMVNHRSAADRTEAGVQALTAGTDMDMMSAIYPDELVQAARAGKVPVAVIDRAVRRVLEVKERLGLFEDPYRGADPARERAAILAPAHRAAARDVARQSIVLLRNEGGLLPLDKNVRRIAVIGPLADNPGAMLGPWAGQGRPEDVTTLLSALRAYLPSTAEITYVQGAGISDQRREGFEAAVAAARAADVVLLAVGEAAEMSGEAASRTDLGLPGVQQALAEAVLAAGKPTVVILSNGRPLAIPWLAQNAPALLETWFLGTEAGYAITDVLFGDYNPSGRLTVSFPNASAQTPLYYNHKATGRPGQDAQPYTSRYLDAPTRPLFPFGHGLSYTTFAYDNLRLSPVQVGAASDTLEVQVDVRNTGARAGTETVQLYVTDLAASVTPPVLELKGFHRLTLAPGAGRTVTFRMPLALLAVYNPAMEHVVEPGYVEILVGRSSADLPLKGAVEITGRPHRVSDEARYTRSMDR